MAELIDPPHPIPAEEAGRQRALDALQILDTEREPAFDDLVLIASQLLGVPMALVSLVDRDRQWFKATVGIDATETTRSESFCAHAILYDEILEVRDARLDPRFAAKPAVTGELGVRFYAGAPLIGSTGFRYGTLCVVDTAPRTLSVPQRDALTALARRASAQLEAHRLLRDAAAREETLQRLLETMPNGVVTCGPDGTLKEFNGTARAWHGVDPRALPPSGWADYFGLYEPDGSGVLPEDRIPLYRAWKGESIRETELVIRSAGQPDRVVLCNAEPLRTAAGQPLGAVCVMHDVTHLRQATDTARIEATRFMDSFASAAQGMALVSLEGRWLHVNDALCNMFGFGRDEFLATDFQRLTHPEDLQADLGLVQELLSGRRDHYHMDKRYFAKDGRTLWAHLSVSLVRDAAGQPLHFVSQIQDYTQRHLAEQKLRESEVRFRSVLEHSYDAFVSVDESGAIVEWNRAAEATFGWRRSEVLGKSMSEIIVPPAMRAAHTAGMKRYLTTGQVRIIDQRLRLAAWHRNQHEFPVEMTISVVELGGRRFFNAFMHDVSKQVESETRLRESELRLRTVADNVPAMIGHVGADRRYQFVNRRYAEWFGLEPEMIVGRHMSDLLQAAHYRAVSPKLDQVQSGQMVEFDLDVADSSGQVRHMHAAYVPDRSNGAESASAGLDAKPSGFHLMISDVSAHKELARVLEQRALRDELTGLPNRAAWAEELDRGMARAQRTGAAHATVMFIDLDRFKHINDTHGHAAGDAVLKEFASRLRSTLRRNDFVARLAGDEFVALLENIETPGRDARTVAAKIVDAAAQPFTFNGQTIDIRPSIGVAIQGGPVFSASDLVEKADTAMYVAKRNATDSIEVVLC